MHMSSVPSPEDTVANWTIVLAIATIALAAFTGLLLLAAFKQLPVLRAQLNAILTQITDAQKAAAADAEVHRRDRASEEWRHIEANTLRACERYFSDPVIHAASQRFFAATSNGTKYNRECLSSVEHDLLTILNYMNGMGVGVKEGIFSGEIIRDHMPNTIKKIVDIIIPHYFDDPSYFDDLIRLRRAWDEAKPFYRHTL